MSKLKQNLTQINRKINKINNKINRKSVNKRGRVRKRKVSVKGRRGTNIKGLRNRYTLVDTLSQPAISYAEAVVCPFEDKAIGCRRPDGQVGTVGATDKLVGLFNMKQVAIDFEASTSVALTGFILTLLPRSLAVGWLRGGLFSGTLGTEHIIPVLSIQELDTDLRGFATSAYDSVISDAYCLLFTILGADGSFYRYNCEAGLTSSEFTVGINLIRTPRMLSIKTNFDTLRLLGAGIKLWPNSAPISTGGHVYSGAFRLRDLYEMLAGLSQTSISGFNIESALKDNYKTFAGLDGTTVRYNPLIEPKQLNLQQLQLNFKAVTYEITAGIYQTLYEYNEILPNQVHDLASANAFVPMVIWRYGNEAVYDVTFSMVAHVEGATDGVCPFEAEAPISEHNLDHLDKFLKSDLFARYVAGHSFVPFYMKAKEIAASVTKGTAKILKMFKLLENYEHIF
jgi:hypothetical protein